MAPVDLLDCLVFVELLQREEPLGNCRILALVSVPDLKGTELGSGHRQETSEPETGTARETTNGHFNKIRIPELARNQSEPEPGTDFGILLAEIAGNLPDPVVSGRTSLTWVVMMNSSQE